MWQQQQLNLNNNKNYFIINQQNFTKIFVLFRLACLSIKRTSCLFINLLLGF